MFPGSQHFASHQLTNSILPKGQTSLIAHMTSNQYNFAVPFVLFYGFLCSLIQAAEAFAPSFQASVKTTTATLIRTVSASTQLNAWALPSALSRKGGSWYNVIEPTARKVVYDDIPPMDYGFEIGLFDNDRWSSSFGSSDSLLSLVTDESTSNSRKGLIRRVSSWTRAVRQGQSMVP
jgi:hypothetical protein